MSGKDKELEVIVKINDLETKLYGSPNDVISAFLKFMAEIYPNYELISKLTLTVDFEEILKDLEDILLLTPEGLVITITREQTGERENILLHLIKARIGFRLGKLTKDSLSIAEIITSTGGKTGSVAARLSELVDVGWVDRVGRGEYKITTYGIACFRENDLPRIRKMVEENKDE
jgi:hypothetical protein